MTTNSPNPVDGDVQALIEKEMDAFEKWFLSYRTDWDKESIYRINYKNGPGYSSAYVQAMWMGWNAHKECRPPGQLLRPVELPGIKTERSDWSAWNWIEHLGGRFQNGQPGDYIEFGSVYAVAQMLKQYRRTVTAEVIAEIADSLRQQGIEVKHD